MGKSYLCSQKGRVTQGCDIAAGVQTISSQAMRTVRYLGDLERDLAPKVTGAAQKCRLFFLSASDHALFGQRLNLLGRHP
jgi:hypothetical protein